MWQKFSDAGLKLLINFHYQFDKWSWRIILILQYECLTIVEDSEGNVAWIQQDKQWDVSVSAFLFCLFFSIGERLVYKLNKDYIQIRLNLRKLSYTYQKTTDEQCNSILSFDNLFGHLKGIQ